MDTHALHNDDQRADDDSLSLGTGGPTPQALLELLRRQPAQGKCDRLRRYERYNCTVPVTLEIEGAIGPDGKPWCCAVIVDNISAGGCGCVSSEQIPVGTAVRASFGELQAGAALRGIVRRCAPTVHGTFKIGIAFAEKN